MAYAEIVLGDPIRYRVGGIEREPGWHDELRAEHKAMEDWSSTMDWAHDGEYRVDHSYHEWPKDGPLPGSFGRYTDDVQMYRERLESTHIGEINHWWFYACGELKAKIEYDFDDLVAPVIRREAPQTLTKTGRLHSFGLLDPRVDDFVWPKDLQWTFPPCIEIQRGYAKTMPIQAIMHPTVKRGMTTFSCKMRYNDSWRLVKAECRIIRSQEWLVDVRFTAGGAARLGKVTRLS